ncbi:MAG TPA: RNA polymerase sigma factor [Vicinamibacterales bacterium]|nr:RNA polymerase sigma factor [Vicinamibacterales bacterium]
MTAAAAAGNADHLRHEDDELVARARAGDTAAFGELVRRLERPVYRAALAALGSPDEAEEAAQDAFVAAFRRLGTFRGESSLKTWLVAIVWRKALTRRRKLQLLRFRSAHRAAEGDPDPIELAPETGAGPHEGALGAELRERLRREIRGLPRKLRDPLLLIASGNHSYEDAAAILGVPVGTAKWRVSEARRILRGKLREAGYEP